MAFDCSYLKLLTFLSLSRNPGSSIVHAANNPGMGGMNPAVISMMRSALHHQSQVPARHFIKETYTRKKGNHCSTHRLIVCYRDRASRVLKRGACCP